MQIVEIEDHLLDHFCWLVIAPRQNRNIKMSELTNSFMYFQIIKDYRQESKVEHKLLVIILLTICGVFRVMTVGMASLILAMLV